ncbi:monophenol monooxygenase [Fusarium circinatum]|uniref:Monophenol monooxygenase n=1 Tax=Fusarium circinatum TaxID=48490 RepID=A0A8H5X231_FUSCI|nr:monophenol monooxygenase [Fusarium circinatum]
MHLPSLLATALFAAVPGSCAPTHDYGCKTPLVRKEWRTLSTKDKHEYINAVKCLATKSSQTGNIYAGAKSRYDDFQVSHIVNTDFIHYVGFFQAWHRMFIAQYEKDLRSLCCYSGAQPYWDTPVAGRTGGGCVTNGPFAEGEFEVHAGPDNSTAYNPRCLARDISAEYGVSKLNQTMVDWTLGAKDFFEFDQRVQGGNGAESQGYHGGGHLSIGGSLGEMGDMYSSPGDPIFWLHHTNVDRLWDKWQRLDWPARKSDIGGPDTQYAYPYDFFGDKEYKNITLAYVMDFGNLLPERRYVTVEEAMDTQGERLFYTYDS